MPRLNENYLKLKDNYLFAEIAKRVNAYIQANPDKPVIRMGIGDVTRPLSHKVIEGLHEGVNHMTDAKTFKGYAPDYGYDFLREAIQSYYKEHNAEVAVDEIFVSDGAKSDTGNIGELFDRDNVVLIPDPVYPVYVDTNIMAGRKVEYLDANASNDFLPMPDQSKHADIIYICSPNNPTGAAYNREQLKVWVDYAIANEAVILFDAAYECFVADTDTPRSIYEIEGAKKCAIEFCSLSKTAGFTGTRLGYTVVPNELSFTTSSGNTVSMNALWSRRQSTKLNGVSYIVQRGAAEVFTEEGMAECKKNIEYYKENAKVIAACMEKKGITYFGGKNSPYIWFECPNGMESWEFFDLMLNKIQVVGTPGAGFGNNGKYYFRLSSFNTYENTVEAMRRFDEAF